MQKPSSDDPVLHIGKTVIRSTNIWSKLASRKNGIPIEPLLVCINFRVLLIDSSVVHVYVGFNLTSDGGFGSIEPGSDPRYAEMVKAGRRKMFQYNQTLHNERCLFFPGDYRDDYRYSCNAYPTLMQVNSYTTSLKTSDCWYITTPTSTGPMCTFPAFTDGLSVIACTTTTQSSVPQVYM